MTPAVGRLIAPADDAASAPPVAVLSYRYWQRRFDGRADAIGRTILINKVPATIVGVSAAGFDGTEQVGETVDVSVPLAAPPAVPAGSARPRQAGLLVAERDGAARAGATAEQAARRARAGVPGGGPRRLGVARRTRSPIGPTIRGCSSSLARRAHNETRRAQRTPLLLLLTLGGLVLAAACVNVSTLLVARADARSPRLRAAPGARRQPRAASSGSASSRRCCCRARRRSAGTVVAWLSPRRAARAASLRPQSHGRARSAARRPDPRRRRPASRWCAPWRSRCCRRCRPAASTSRRRSRAARGRCGGRRRSWVVRGLLAVQVALSLVLLISAGLFSRTLARLDAVDAGFDQRGLLLFRIDATSAGYADDRRGRAARSDPRHGSPRCPASASVTYSRVPLLSRVRQNKSFVLPGTAPARLRPPVNTNGVAPNFFAAMALPMIAGRGFAETRIARARRRSRWSTRRSRASSSPAPIRSAGAIAFGAPGLRRRRRRSSAWPRDAKYTDLRGEMPPTIYLPAYQRVEGDADFAVRAAGDPAAALMPAVQAAIREHRSDACRSSTCGRSTSRSSACTRASACSRGSRRSSASRRWRWRWPACTGCCRRRCSGGRASSGCGWRSARRRRTSAG